MFTISIIIAFILTALIIAQGLLAAGFIARLRRPPVPPLPDNECPKVALIICIRGKDPTLLECLNGALNQDYPDYGLHIVVDSRNDPAWPVVNKIVAANPQTPSNVQVLQNPLTTCSLKCSSLIQAVSGLEPDREVLALADSDVIPTRRWLRDLVAPLADPQIGATTGHRWFMPSPYSLANLARNASNAAAVVLTYWLSIASGCSLAIRRKVIDEGHLLDRWTKAYGDDTTINSSLEELGLRLEIVPKAMLPEFEDCDIAGFKDWLTRQLLSCRLHHQGWWGVILHGLGTSLVLGLALVILGAGIAWQQWNEITPLAGALAAYLVSMMGLLAWLNNAHAQATASQSSAETKKNKNALWRVGPSILLAQFIYAIALFTAHFASTVEWRGVRYHISGRNEIRMEGHHPVQVEKQRDPSRRCAGVSIT